MRLHRLVCLVPVLAASACAMKHGTAAPEAAAKGTDRSAAAPLPPSPLEIRQRGGAWEKDERWAARLRDLAATAGAAFERVRSETGLAFDAGRGPVAEFDETAPAEGDVSVRFVEGVRRPLLRISPRALLCGEFRASADLAPLVASAAIRAAAGERSPPAWIVQGASIVAGDVLERRLNQRAIGGASVRSRDEELLGTPATDPLAAAVRVKALLRCARAERPLVRLLALATEGRDEESMLSDLGIGQRAFLDAASDTERDRAAESIQRDGLFAALRDVRGALARGDVAGADAACAAVAGAIDDAGGNPWIAADLRLCRAQIAVLRADAKAAKAAWETAGDWTRILRVRDARVTEACVAALTRGSAQTLRALAADWLDALAMPPLTGLIPVPAAVRAKNPAICADVFSPDPLRRKAAAVQIGEAGGRESAVALRLLAGDSDAPVRRAAVAALAVALGHAADDDVEAATRDADASVRGTALELLAVSDRGRAAKRAAAMKDDPDPAVRRRAAELARTK